MREIKFRAFIQSQDGSYICNYSDVLFPHIFWNNVYKGIYDTDPEQHIGIKDKNGVDIYEGDILANKYFNGINFVIKGNGVVIYREAAFRIKWENNEWWLFDKAYHDGLEIIGNIYENKELLNERT